MRRAEDRRRGLPSDRSGAVEVGSGLPPIFLVGIDGCAAMAWPPVRARPVHLRFLIGHGASHRQLASQASEC